MKVKENLWKGELKMQDLKTDLVEAEGHVDTMLDEILEISDALCTVGYSKELFHRLKKLQGELRQAITRYKECLKKYGKEDIVLRRVR